MGCTGRAGSPGRGAGLGVGQQQAARQSDAPDRQRHVAARVLVGRADRKRLAQGDGDPRGRGGRGLVATAADQEQGEAPQGSEGDDRAAHRQRTYRGVTHYGPGPCASESTPAP